MKNVFRSVIKAEFVVLVCLSLSVSPSAKAQYFSMNFVPPIIPMSDIYPDRHEFVKNSLSLCRALTTQGPQMADAAIIFSVKNILLSNANFLKRSTDDQGVWNADFDVAVAGSAFLRILKNKYSLTISLRQSEDAIESIASVTMENNCTITEGIKFSYFNNQKRLIRKVKVDTNFKELESVTAEEAVRPAEKARLVDHRLRIGIIDSGVDYNHKKLFDKTRPMLGLDLTNPDRPPYDYTNSVQNEMMGKHFSHGSAVSDIASRDADVLIIPARVENKSILTGDAVEFLAKQGVHLINISQGTTREPEWLPLKAAIAKHPEILFVISAGNDSLDLSVDKFYPSTFVFDNVVVVASIDKAGQLSKFSNYSDQYVHFAAYGEEIIAAEAARTSWTVNGTSFSAPLVTNIAAKLLIENPNLTTQQLKNILISNAKPLPSLKGKVRYGALGVP